MQSGPEQFQDWMRRRGFNQADASRYFEWDQSFVSTLLSGRRNPGLETAIKIERLAGIPVEAWASSEVDEPEIEAVAGTAKRRRDK